MSKTLGPFDVVVVGGTPAGLMAAVAAARKGCTVGVFDRYSRPGGLVSNGLGATDIGTRGATWGLFGEFITRIRSHYETVYGKDSPQVRDCSGGYLFEPQVAARVLEEMVSEQPKIVLHLSHEFETDPVHVEWKAGRIQAVTVMDKAAGVPVRVEGAMFIDATYEGDLADAAGVPYRIGREDAREFREPMAGKLYKAWGCDPSAGTTGRGDHSIQAYNYRLCLTRDPANRVEIPKPATYRREDYESLVDDIVQDRVAGIYTKERYWDGIGRITNIVDLPNGKTDANNQHLAFLSTDLPEENWPWPMAGWAWRDRFAARLRDYITGLFWFAQNDPALPESFRRACAEWGFARDEYADNGHFPRQVYVREGRRIEGLHRFTAHDSLPVGGSPRPPIHPESITASHYALDSHAVLKREPGRAHLDGFFSHRNQPYTVPYGVMVPAAVPNLLVPVAVSSTHVGFSTLRMEPCWMALGQAAGTAASLCLAAACDVQQVDRNRLRDDLLAQKAVLVYIRDLTPDDPDFAALQRMALRGLVSGWELDGEAAVDDETLKTWCGLLGLPVIRNMGAVQMSRRQMLVKLDHMVRAA